MPYNAELDKQVAATLRAKLERFEAVYAAVPTQIDAAGFCRLLLTEIEHLLSGHEEVPVSLQDAAHTSGYSPDHLRRLIRTGHLRTLRTGRYHKVLLSEVPRRHRGARSLTAAADVEVCSVPEAVSTTAGDQVTPAPPPESASQDLATSPQSRYDPIADARMAAARVRGG